MFPALPGAAAKAGLNSPSPKKKLVWAEYKLEEHEALELPTIKNPMKYPVEQRSGASAVPLPRLFKDEFRKSSSHLTDHGRLTERPFSVYGIKSLSEAEQLKYLRSMNVQKDTAAELKEKLNFIYAEYGDDVHVTEALLENPTIDSNVVYTTAISLGYEHSVERIIHIKSMDPAAADNEAIKLASMHGHLPVVNFLLKYPKVNPSAQNNLAVWYAAYHGYYDVVDRLMKHPRVNPADNDNRALKLAASKGYTAIVKLLLTDKRVDPSAALSKAQAPEIQSILTQEMNNRNKNFN
jgi:hypothetical protein